MGYLINLCGIIIGECSKSGSLFFIIIIGTFLEKYWRNNQSKITQFKYIAVEKHEIYILQH